MNYEDPLRTISVELPSGWVYAPFDSTLTSFSFTRWDHPEEMVVVHVRPSAIPAEESDEQWVEKIRAEIGGAAELNDVVSGGNRAVAADFASDKGSQRVAFIRGGQVDVVAEQRGKDVKSPERRTALEMVVRTAASTVNSETPAMNGADEFNRSIQAANEAFEKNDFSAAARELQQAVQGATAAWLNSLAPPVSSPDVQAATRMAQVLMNLGGLVGVPFLQRDAESVLRRALRTVESMGDSEAAKKLGDEISQDLHRILSELLKQDSETAVGTLSPVAGMRERGAQLAQAAARAFEEKNFEGAYSLSGMAAEDFLALISILRRTTAQEVPEDIAAQLAGQGIEDAADQKTAFQRAREAILYQPLNLSLRIRYCCAIELQVPGALEAAEILIPVAELISESDPGGTWAQLNMALAMIASAGALAQQGSASDLEEAERCLRRAGRILDSRFGDAGSNEDWIRFLDRQIQAALQTVERRLESLAEGSEIKTEVESLRFHLESITTQFRNKFPGLSGNIGDVPQRPPA